MRSEITTIIFSKNRACQLELLLRGLTMPAVVQYTCDPSFTAGYKKLIGMYPNVTFVRETTFKETLFELLRNAGEYILFLVDDDVIIEPFSENCPEFAEFKRNQEIICLSLRMSPKYDCAPTFVNNTWRWEAPGLSRGWRCPMSASSHIFRKEVIDMVLQKNIRGVPNSLEHILKRNPPPARPLMMCFDTPKVINNLANRVQNRFKRLANLGISVEMLETEFLKGKRLSLEYIKEKALEAKDCFLMTEYEWESKNTFEYVVNKFNVDLSKPSPTTLQISRNIGFPDILNELGFKTGVELGIFKGKYSEVLSDRISGLSLTAIDSWKAPEGSTEYEKNKIEGGAYDQAKMRAQKKGFRIIKEFSVPASKQFADESLDFIYIHGNHDFAHVIQDLATWSPKIKTGGIISGYNFFDHKEERFATKEAIIAWCNYKNIQRIFIINADKYPSWFYIKL